MKTISLWVVITATLAMLAMCYGRAEAQLPHNIPDLCATSSSVIQPGATQTWVGDQVKPCVAVRGTLIIPAGGRLFYDTIMVYAGGFLDVQPGGQLIRRDVPLTPSTDPEQYGGGLLFFGRFRALGDPKTPYVRLAAAPTAGSSSLELAGMPVGWQVGDRIAVPDTRQLNIGAETDANYQPQWEVRTLTSIGSTVTLNAPLLFNHPGADGFLPHVANLTRSTVVSSQNATGTRGHLLATGTADVEIRDVRFESMGRTTSAPLNCSLGTTDAQQYEVSVFGDTCRYGSGPMTYYGTNQIGRYAFHAHHLDGPSGLPDDVPQFRVEGSVFEDSRKWPIAIHNAHYGLVKNNVMFQWTGAGLMTEDGSETMNVIDGNFALVGVGGGGGRSGFGREGVGFYFRGPNNIVRNNIAANILPAVGDADSAYGFKFYFTYLTGQPDATMSFPPEKGSTARVQLNPYTLPIRGFSGNEVYGATESGLTYWWVGTWGSGATRTNTRSFLSDTRVWNVYNKGIFQYENALTTIDGFVTRNVGLAYDGADYFADRANLTRFDLQGSGASMLVPTVTSGPFTISNSVIPNGGIVLRTLWVSAHQAEPLPARTVVVSGITGSTNPLQFEYGLRGSTTDTVTLDMVTLDGVRKFYPEQAASFIVPKTEVVDGRQILGVPEANLTNEQAWAIYGKAIAGAVSDGSAPPPPPPPPADSDGDGVTDDLDKCPGTPAGTVVDANGCAVIQPPPPPPPPDPCTDSPLRITRVRGWPGTGTSVRPWFDWSGPAALASIAFTNNLTTLTITDTRPCSASVNK